jgi:hypothetical protein
MDADGPLMEEPSSRQWILLVVDLAKDPFLFPLRPLRLCGETQDPENKLALISLLNAILTLPVPIVDVTIENPCNFQDFQNDKLSILDIRAVDQRGAIYDVEMQFSTHSGLVKRIVFYGCESHARAWVV